jgi:hypothetical protein
MRNPSKTSKFELVVAAKCFIPIPYPSFPKRLVICQCVSSTTGHILVVPLLVQIVYQPILILVSPPSSVPPAFVTERDTTVPSPRGHEASARGGEDDEHVLLSVSITSRPLSEDTHSNEAIYPRPHSVVWQLSPPALVHNRPLVYTTTCKVHQHRDHDDDAEYAAWTQCLLGLVYASAGGRRPAFEEICAFVYGCDEGYACLRQWVRVAKERDDGRLSARVLVILALVAILIFVLVG